jgi:predicted AlkP superfamily pyrophosphatase or phosphodiesterase
MKTILLLIDALRHDYVTKEDMPFLHSQTRKGYYVKRVRPSLGFCERAEIFTGQKNEEMELLTAFGYSRIPNEWGAMSKRLAFFHGLENGLKAIPMPEKLATFARGKVRAIIKRFFLPERMGRIIYFIPFKLLPNFNLTEDAVDHTSPYPFGTESIFDLVRSSGKTFSYEVFTSLSHSSHFGSDNERLERAVEIFESERPDFLPVYISGLDTAGHTHGPNSSRFKEELGEMDTKIKYYTKKIQEIDRETCMVFLGDHGMLEVDEKVDVIAEIRKIVSRSNWKLDRDFTVFLDSTCARFWFHRSESDELRGMLEASEIFKNSGSFSDSASEKYGDLIWYADPGCVVSPDFFRIGPPCMGMHGYDPEISESKGTCIINGPALERKVINETHLSNIYHLLVKCLEIK